MLPPVRAILVALLRSSENPHTFLTSQTPSRPFHFATRKVRHYFAAPPFRLVYSLGSKFPGRTPFFLRQNFEPVNRSRGSARVKNFQYASQARKRQVRSSSFLLIFRLQSFALTSGPQSLPSLFTHPVSMQSRRRMEAHSGLLHDSATSSGTSSQCKGHRGCRKLGHDLPGAFRRHLDRAPLCVVPA